MITKEAAEQLLFKPLREISRADLEGLTIKQLRELGLLKGHGFVSSIDKAELIRCILKAFKDDVRREEMRARKQVDGKVDQS